MDFRTITSSDELWCKVRNYAENRSWRAGKKLASAMDHNEFSDWERVIAAFLSYGTSLGRSADSIAEHCTSFTLDIFKFVYYN